VALAPIADAHLFRLEAIIGWLDAVDVHLKQLPSSRTDGRGRHSSTNPDDADDLARFGRI
jgi:hypothetical protein